MRIRDSGNLAVTGARGQGIIFGQWNQRKCGERGSEAFELDLEESVGLGPVEMDREGGVLDRSVHITTYCEEIRVTQVTFLVSVLLVLKFFKTQM